LISCYFSNLPANFLSLPVNLLELPASDLSIMESYRVISEEKVADFRANFMDKEEDNSRKFLPVPATYIISQEGIIDFVYFDPNYRVRISNMELLKHL